MKLDAPDFNDEREALSELAWYELVEEAEKEMPILAVGSAASAQVWQGQAVVDRLAGMAKGVWGVPQETINELLRAA